jgi:hypothetical protein
MPNQPKTQHRAVRVSDDLWIAAQERARELGESVADVIRRGLREYTSRDHPSR